MLSWELTSFKFEANEANEVWTPSDKMILHRQPVSDRLISGNLFREPKVLDKKRPYRHAARRHSEAALGSNALASILDASIGKIRGNKFILHYLQ